MTPRASRWRSKSRLVCGIVLAGVILVGAIWKSKTRQERNLASTGAAHDSGDLSPMDASPFRNVNQDVAYSGANKCRECHPAEHASYERTGHSRALADLNIATEPADGEFDDPRSQRTYRVHREGNTIQHEESIKTASGEKLVLADLPIRYVIGSGRYSRSYLVERDSILYESPATWYAARPGWAISPGYQDSNPGFQRAAEVRCLWCHVGRVEPVDRSPQRVAIHTQAIDCERCHGAGSMHVAKQEAKGNALESSAVDDQTHDDTIVNPSRLERRRSEDICAQCHYQTAATVELRGRSMLDFRPGQRLADYRVHFSLEALGQRMNVVGHFEQMRLSRCYIASDSLTCMTCHPPHAKPTAEESQAFYRSKCLSCHTAQSCGMPPGKRLEQDPGDNCVACHMPRSPTEILHFAFNHHRIGIHPKAQEPNLPAEPVLAESGELIPLDDVTWMSPYDQARNLGLAYLRFSDKAGPGEQALVYRRRALEILEQIDYARHDDFEVRAALAELYWGIFAGRTLDESRAVANAPQASPDALATASFALASTLYNMRQPAEALTWLERTIRLRPSADVWMMLSECRVYAGDLNGGLQAARNASEMAPDRPRYLARLVELIESLDKPQAVNQSQPEHGRNSAHESAQPSASEPEAAMAALKRRVQILREYRDRLEQMAPSN